MAGHRRGNGEGTIYRRKDGRYEAAAYVLTASGKRKRIRIYAKTRAEAHEKLNEATAAVHAGQPTPDRTVKLGDYLDYWLEEIVQTTRRPKTFELYEATTRLNLKPALGASPIRQLSVRTLQTYLNQELALGRSVRKVQVIRTVLSAALTRAQREELVTRNVARLVELPHWERAEIQPWSVAEATRFLEVARADPFYPAFVLLVFYGLRRGEVLGLRWHDVDFTAGVICIRQQLQRVGGALQQGPLKTSTGKRDLPLVSAVRTVLSNHQVQQIALCTSLGDSWEGDGSGRLVITSSCGSPMDPRNFARSFHRLCARHGIRRIKVHHIRHTTATLLKGLGVPARDAQLILGHSRISTTQELYQHDNMASRQEALERVEELLSRTTDSSDSSKGCRQVRLRSRQKQPSKLSFAVQNTLVISGGASGIRTPDLLRAISIHSCIADRATEVNRVVNECRRCWLLGLVAVSVAVKTEWLIETGPGDATADLVHRTY